jgi:titin
VEYQIGFSSTWTQIPENVAETSYTHTGLTEGTSYSYRVKAINSGGESAYSSSASAVPQPVPSAPTGVTAVAQSSSSINISWNPVSGAVSYKVYFYAPSYSPWGPAASNITGTSYAHTGLRASTVYYYSVRAVNSAGIESDSASVSATTPASGGGGGGSDITYSVSATGSPATTALSFSFSSSVSGLTASNITITNGTGSATKGSLTGSGTSWSLGITTSTAGTISVSINKSGISSSPKTVTLVKSGGSGGGETETILEPDTFWVEQDSDAVFAHLLYPTSQKSTVDTYTYILYEDGKAVFAYTDAPDPQDIGGYGFVGGYTYSGSSYLITLFNKTLLSVPGTYKIKVEIRKSGATSYFTQERTVIITD